MIHSNASRAPTAPRIIPRVFRRADTALVPSPRRLDSTRTDARLAVAALGPRDSPSVPADIDARPRLDVMAPLGAPGTISKIIVTPSVVLGVCDGCVTTRDARAR
jgi:hypothetical protein